MSGFISVNVDTDKLTSFLVGENEVYFLADDGDVFRVPMYREQEGVVTTMNEALKLSRMGSQMFPSNTLLDPTSEELRSVCAWLIAEKAFKAHNRIIRGVQEHRFEYTVLYRLEGMDSSEPPQALFFSEWCESDAVQKCLMLLPDAEVVFVTHGWHEKSAVNLYQTYGKRSVYGKRLTEASA